MSVWTELEAQNLIALPYYYTFIYINFSLNFMLWFQLPSRRLHIQDMKHASEVWPHWLFHIPRRSKCLWSLAMPLGHDQSSAFWLYFT